MVVNDFIVRVLLDNAIVRVAGGGNARTGAWGVICDCNVPVRIVFDACFLSLRLLPSGWRCGRSFATGTGWFRRFGVFLFVLLLLASVFDSEIKVINNIMGIIGVLRTFDVL